MGASRRAILDLVLLDPGNPRSAAFQIDRIADHLAALPQGEEGGLLDTTRRLAVRLQANLRTAQAQDMDLEATSAVEQQLRDLSDAIAGRFFTHPSEMPYAPGETG